MNKFEEDNTHPKMGLTSELGNTKQRLPYLGDDNHPEMRRPDWCNGLVSIGLGLLGELFQVFEQLGGSLGVRIKIFFVALVTKEPLSGGAGVGQP